MRYNMLELNEIILVMEPNEGTIKNAKKITIMGEKN